MDENNKRSSDRLEHELVVSYETVDGFVSEWAVNVSKGGCFVNARSPLPVGSQVKLIVNLPGTDFPFSLHGKVAWIDGPASGAPGMGIEFEGVDDATRAEIERFVDRLRATL